MDYVSFCKKFFAATNIPLNLLRNGNVEYSALGEILSVAPGFHWDIFPPNSNPGFCSITPDLQYGRIQINEEYDLILGPAFSVPVTDDIVRLFMREAMAPLDHREQLAEYLCSIPRLSYLQFCKYLDFLYLCLNGKETDFLELQPQENPSDRNRNARQANDFVENMENGNLHNSYYFERELYQIISEGNVERLKEFLQNGNVHKIKEGKMAHTPLRHSKNIFISATAKAGMLGAIPGGVDVEKTYQLMDFYIQECERLQTIEEVANLQSTMVMDFCQRAGEAHIPGDMSSEVYLCMNYIRAHTNEPIRIYDVARHVHRSSSYMMKRFREELGIHIGAFITRCKLEEAKSLLLYSNKSLSEISSYLCFSSQSYFQRVFKRQYGITPMQYRKKGLHQ